MAAERRGGFALFAVIMLVLVFAVAATVVVTALSGNNDQYRIEQAADVLHRLAAEIDTTRTGSNLQSFVGQVTVYPSKLSQLYSKIQNTDIQCSATGTTQFGATNGPKWRGPYHLTPIPTTGLTLAPGLKANDAIFRNSATVISIQIPNAPLRDAQGLELFVDANGKSDGTGPVVVFSSTDPTTINYRISNLGAGCT